MRKGSVEFQALQGGGACGNVRYRLSSEPIYVHCCHCRSCQRESGSALALNAMIESDKVELLSVARWKLCRHLLTAARIKRFFVAPPAKSRCGAIMLWRQ